MAVFRERGNAKLGDLSEIERGLHLARYQFAAILDLGANVLDCACGTGYGTEILAAGRADRQVTGVDVSAEAVQIARAQRTGKQVSFEVSDATCLKHTTGSYTAIVSFETVEHVPNADTMLARFGSALDPSGLLVVSTPNAYVTSPIRRLRPANRFHSWEQDPQSFVKRLERAEFRVVASYGQAWLNPRMRALYRLARCRGQLMAAARLSGIDRPLQQLEALLVRVLRKSVVREDRDSFPTQDRPLVECVYQVHVCTPA